VIERLVAAASRDPERAIHHRVAPLTTHALADVVEELVRVADEASRPKSQRLA
jgi:hypothetical protein